MFMVKINKKRDNWTNYSKKKSTSFRLLSCLTSSEFLSSTNKKILQSSIFPPVLEMKLFEPVKSTYDP